MNATPSHTRHAGPLAIDPVAVGLQALTWIAADGERLQRFLSLTGLDPARLRARAAAPDVLAAVFGFLEAHEPDLVACAAALELPPETLVRAHGELTT